MKILQKNIRFMLLVAITTIILPYKIKTKEITTLSDNMQDSTTESSNAEKFSLHTIVVNQSISTEDKLERMQSLLIDKFINVNARNANGKTALNLAVFYNAKPIIIQFLIANNADVNLPDVFNETPLHNAIRKEELIIARMLLQAGANKNLKNDTGETPIDLARSQKTIALFGFTE